MEKLSATFQSRQELWQSRISAYRSSGLTVKDWCEKNQVSLSALRYWITKTNQSGEKDDPLHLKLFLQNCHLKKKLPK